MQRKILKDLLYASLICVLLAEFGSEMYFIGIYVCSNGVELPLVDVEAVFAP